MKRNILCPYQDLDLSYPAYS